MKKDPESDIAAKIKEDFETIHLYCLRADEAYRKFRVSVMQGDKPIPSLAPQEWIPICNQ